MDAIDQIAYSLSDNWPPHRLIPFLAEARISGLVTFDCIDERYDCEHQRNHPVESHIAGLQHVAALDCMTPAQTAESERS
jgi:hypothetical protein